MSDKLISPAEAAKILKLTERRVRALCKSQRWRAELGAVQVSGRWVLRESAVRAFKKLDREPGNPNWRES